MMNYTIIIDGESTEITAIDTRDAEEQAREWAVDADWSPYDRPHWVDVRIVPEKDPDDWWTITVTIPAREPDCPAGEHEWKSPHYIVGGLRVNPGVFGHGGGVIINEVCVRCGAKRITDTWATRPDTGEVVGEVVTYEPPGTVDLWPYQRERIAAIVDADPRFQTCARMRGEGLYAEVHSDVDLEELVDELREHSELEPWVESGSLEIYADHEQYSVVFE